MVKIRLFLLLFLRLCFAKNAYNFSEQKVKQFGNTINDGWKNVSNFFKFAEANRHQQKPILQNSGSTNQKNNTHVLSSMENELDELSMKIFMKLKGEIALEYVRSGRN